MKSPVIHLMLAFAVCAVALAGYGVWYTIIANKSTAVTTLQNEIDIKTETINRMAATRATIAEISNDEATVQNYFVPETEVVTFIDYLEARGRAQKATINILSVSAGTMPAQSTLGITLSIAGTFDAVMRTIGAIEYAPYAISISTLSVGQNEKNTWVANLTLTAGSRVASTTTNTL
jgi:hypothetical protein